VQVAVCGSETRLISQQPSIQKLVTTFSTECLIHLSEEVIRTSAYTAPTPGVDSSIRTLEEEFSPAVIDRKLTKAAVECAVKRIKQCLEETNETVRITLSMRMLIVIFFDRFALFSRLLLGLLHMYVFYHCRPTNLSKASVEICTHGSEVFDGLP
jgi:proteasome activator subunit 4